MVAGLLNLLGRLSAHDRRHQLDVLSVLDPGFIFQFGVDLWQVADLRQMRDGLG